MTMIMFRALSEQNPDIIVAEKRLETTSTAKHVFTIIIIIYNSLDSLPVQSVACQSNKSNSAITISANKMDANNKTINSKSTGSEEYTSIDVSYID